MPSYRVELAKLGRAVCKNAECKANQVKIDKGSLRFGTLVEIKEHSSWMWKHWGCVTPKQIHNWKELSDGDPELMDGLEDLPHDMQEKVKRAVEQGHVDDEDWRGDPEVNRLGASGFRKKEKSKKDQGKEQGEDGEAEQKPKKRRRAKKDEDAEAPAPKKSRPKAKKEETSDTEEDSAPPPKKSRSKGKKEQTSDGEEDTAPAPRKANSRTKKATKDEKEAVPAADDDAPVPKAKSKRGRKRDEQGTDNSAEKPKKTSRGKKA